MSSSSKKPAKARSTNASSSSQTTSDPRFASFQTDPRYRLPRRKDTHVKLDKRFASMLHEEDFSSKRKVDRYGRRLPEKKGQRKELERLYDFEDVEQPGESGDEDDDVQKELERLDQEESDRAESKYTGFDESSSSEEEDDTSSEEEESEEEDAAVAAGLEGFAGETGAEYEVGESSRRLAVRDLDWDHIRAVDLLAAAQSFCPADGKIESVAVYPSEFGKERMQREELEGPPKELFAKAGPVKQAVDKAEPKRRRGFTEADSESESDASSAEADFINESDNEASSSDEEEEEPEDDDNEDNEDISALPTDATLRASLLKHATEAQPEIDTKALRAYQLTRLKYYYAILTCSSTPTAQSIYNNMDDCEYLSTANYFRLSFVPDDMSFDADNPRDECSIVPPGYRPAEFVTEALTHSKVRLTWDEEDQERKEAQKRAFTKNKEGKKGVEINEDDLAAYVGSDSEDDDVEDDKLEGGVAVPAPATNGKTEAPKDKAALSRRNQMRLALGLPIEDDKPATNGSKATSAKTKATAQKPVGNMQITFSSALSNDRKAEASNGKVFENDPSDVLEESTKDRYIRKEKERKERRREKARAARGELGELAPTNASTEGAAFTKVTDDPSEAKDDDEDPFSDPFFLDPSAANKAARKAAKKLKRETRAAELAKEEERKAGERKELELLMVDEGGAGGKDFDIADIRRAEKEKKRKGKGRKSRSKVGMEEEDGAEAGGEKVDGFNVDVQDPRFRGVFEDFEYAIDPSNPRFSGTEGMKRLLEEGRKRRKTKKGRGDEEVDGVDDRREKRRKVR